MPETWDEKAVFLQALEIPAGERDDFLRRACPGSAQRARVEALLAHHALARRDEFQFQAAESTQTSRLAGQIDEFRILRVLGEGGMGRVYLAEDTILNRKVALKVLARHLTGSESALARFHDEARNAAALKHPGIVPVFRFGRCGDDHYLITEFVEGPTLAELIAQRRKNERRTGGTADFREWTQRCARVIAAVADALDAAHRARIIHRDVKPSNIILDTEGRARLMDFGIAKHVTDDPQTTKSGLVGTYHYMSPEQAAIAGARIDQRSDIFSLGVVMYEMLVLERPFEGVSPAQVLRAIAECEPDRLRVVDRRVPRDLETICLKALEKNVRNRYQSAAHITADLRSFLAGDPILASPPGALRRVRKWVDLHRMLVASTTIVTLLAVIALLGWGLKHAADERLGWISVNSDFPGSTVYLREFDPDVPEWQSEPRFAGHTPLGDYGLKPGQYRVTVVSPEKGSFAEFNVLLTETGRARTTGIVAHKSQAGWNIGAASARSLHGFLRRPDSDSLPDMCVVPAGEYATGMENETHLLQQPRRVRLASFLIDKRPVSNHDYREFVEATGYRPPPYWSDFSYDPAQLDSHPVVSINMHDAEAFARWRGKRLPTMFEWQAAARGPEGKLYPWGFVLEEMKLDLSTPDFALHAFTTRVPAKQFFYYAKGTTATTDYDPRTGLPDLLQIFGNVNEFTETTFDRFKDAVLMGRSWMQPPEDQTLAHVVTTPAHYLAYRHGFRCAKSAMPDSFPTLK